MHKIKIISIGAGPQTKALLSRLAQQCPNIKDFIIIEHPPDEFIPEKIQKSLEAMKIEERLIDYLEIKETYSQIEKTLNKDILKEKFFKHFKPKVPENIDFTKNVSARIRNNLGRM